MSKMAWMMVPKRAAQREIQTDPKMAARREIQTDPKMAAQTDQKMAAQTDPKRVVKITMALKRAPLDPQPSSIHNL